MSIIDLGAVAEYDFASQLLARGIIPAWPSTETQPYDMIAICEKGLHKVQVKGTNHRGPTVRAHVAMRAGKGKSRAYTKADIDFVVIKLFEYDLYYIIPVEKIVKDMRIKPADPACKWQRFKNAWSLLK
jgi:hypothetical protein